MSNASAQDIPTDSHIFFRSAGSVNPVIERAEGIYCYDVAGKRYIDGMGGVGVVSIGHGVPEIREAAMAQMDKVCFAHPFHWKNQPHMELTERIAKFAPPGMTKIFMCSGGSEATETALKLVRQYHLERGSVSKYKVVSRWSSFHGNTLGSLSMTGMRSRRDLFAPLLQDFPKIAACNCYHCPFEREYPSCNMPCAHDLEAIIKREGPENIAAFIAEPIVGAAGGGLTAPDDYFKVIREICDRYDILMIVDEVITGFGRTGKNFGINHWGVVPDIICTGKGLSSGYSPLGAVIVAEKVFEPFRTGRGFSHGYTFGGNPLSCAVGSAVLKYIEDHGLVDRVAQLGAYFFEKAQELYELDIVGDIRGKGFFMGIEFVKDKKTRQPFASSANVAGKIADTAFTAGLIVGAGRGGIDGVLGDHMNLAPPFICGESDLDEIVDIVRASVLKVQNSL
ncbi:aspartate aminotransferase family protein [Mesorhizobium sp. UC74_2]|uniref:aminotransferase family protein n=1 Tax=Mesorhizobium sp. UC74_2 TaxID=3350171 RepID=UPI003670ECCE